MEQADVLSASAVESPFERYVVDICTSFVFAVVAVGIDASAHHHVEAVAEESLGELERVVGACGSVVAARLLHAYIHVHIHRGAYGLACYVVDFVLQEVVEGIGGAESARVGARQIHAGGEKCYCQLVLVFSGHTCQFVLHGHVLGCLDGELQSHVLECAGDSQSYVEQHAAARPVGIAYAGFRLFGCRYVECGVGGFAGKFHIASLLEVECLEWDDRQRVFHLAFVYGVASDEVHHAFRAVVQCHGTSALHIDVTLFVGTELTPHLCSVFNLEVHLHVDSHECVWLEFA